MKPTFPASTILAVAVVWVLATNWDAVASGHPSYLVFYLSALGLGLLVMIRGWSSDEPPRRPWVSWICAVGLLTAAFAAIWLSPFAAEPAALDVLDDPTGFLIVQSASEISLVPDAEDTGVGMVFYPGARVDTRAYLRILAPLARAGTPVVVVKEPLGIAFLSAGFTASWIQAHPGVEDWIVAGHSLGGVAAAATAHTEGVSGLLLWASYPASDISASTALQVSSVYGTNDEVAPPDEVLAAAPDLPQSTQFVPVEGGIHSFFGDYGLQPGDGEPVTDREEAQSQIFAASLALVDSISVGD
ncbi:MAG: alpha/beta hydrolase [Acidimicrobiia bacterium]